MRECAARFALVLVTLLSLAEVARAEGDRDDDRDGVSVVQAGDEVVAIDTVRGLRSSVRLRLEEEVLASDARGRIGVARTSQRLLGLRVGAGWEELSYNREERARPPAQTHIARSAALVPLGRRLAAFTAKSRRWFESSLAGDEALIGVRESRELLVAVTTRRLLAVDPALGDFVQFALDGDESARDASTADRAITILTDQRALTYTAGSGLWVSLGRSQR
jgi:hypothetical protein